MDFQGSSSLAACELICKLGRLPPDHVYWRSSTGHHLVTRAEIGEHEDA